MGVIAQQKIINGGPYYVDYLFISRIAVDDERNADSTCTNHFTADQQLVSYGRARIVQTSGRPVL